MAAGLLLAACSTVEPGGGLSASVVAPSPTASPTADARTDPKARAAAVRAVLEARATAFVTADLAAARATQVSGAAIPTTVRIVRLPLASWAYEVTASSERSGLLDVRARLTWRVEGESSGSEVDQRLALRWSGGRWLVASERSVSDSAPPWELGPLTVVRGKRSIVIAVGEASSRARAAARLVDSAVLGVSKVYGKDWQKRAVLVLTGTDEQMAEGLDWSVAHVRRFGAVTTSVGSVPSATAPADRVWTRAAVWDRLPDRFLLVLLRHEITHVATRATFSASVPLWLEEGYANHVGYTGSDVPDRQALVELLDVVRRSGAPAALPSNAAFADERAGMAYAGGQLACDLIAEGWGEAGLRRVYRLTATGDDTPARNLERALREVTGRGLAGLTADWRARATALAR
ncbi:hypothetical protein [Longivirga aurantiaca]|uniref:Peptidase MA-like domain-containing protein n=1 Tax=Longivirga aurantiaca TaxID=1837743 RepID=A0ABW1T258_9ACTN